MRPIIALILTATFISCERSEDESRLQNNTPAPGKKAGEPIPGETNGQQGRSLQQQVETFFREFSAALSHETPEVAATMVAKEHRNRFRAGYQFWRGTQFLEPVVRKASGDQDVIKVEVTFRNERGTDREIKSLRLIDGNWQLLDS